MSCRKGLAEGLRFGRAGTTEGGCHCPLSTSQGWCFGRDYAGYRLTRMDPSLETDGLDLDVLSAPLGSWHSKRILQGKAGQRG